MCRESGGGGEGGKGEAEIWRRGEPLFERGGKGKNPFARGLKVERAGHGTREESLWAKVKDV